MSKSIGKNIFDSTTIHICEDAISYNHMIKMPCPKCKNILNTKIPMRAMVTENSRFTWECKCGQGFFAEDGLIGLVE